MSSFLLLKSMLLANVLKKSKKKKKAKIIVKIKKVPKIRSMDNSVCRICNNERGVVPIFNNVLQTNIAEEIKEFTGVTVSITDNLPKQMCQSCLDLLNGCITFRDMCQRSNKVLIELSIKKEKNCHESNNVEQAHSDVDDPYTTSPAFFKSDIWECTTCDKDFSELKSYNSHLSECKKKAPKPQPLKKIKSLKTFLCDICGKTARSKASLLVHMGIHENVFPFKCDVCPYQGRTMDLLKVHKRSHLVDKPFKCSQCPKATTTASNLAKHMRHIHSTTRPFKCTYCEKAFSYQHDMKRHVREIHLRQGTVDCDVCYKKFNTKKILQGHRWKIHKIKGERQGRLPSYLQCQTGENMDNCDNYAI